MTDTANRTREQRLRRAAARQGLRLVKSRTRDPRAIDHGSYMLVDGLHNFVVAGTGELGRPHWNLEDVEAYLAGDR